ncbi:MAG: FixH family protein [Caulobacterales bacterium]
MTRANPQTPFVLKGWHVLAGLVAFFGADIAVNTVFMMDAYGSFPGETSVSPYEDGLAYDGALAQLRAQKAMGWRIAAGPDRAGGLQVQVVDRQGAPLSGLRISGQLERPATEIGQKTVTFRATAPGVYAASAGPLSGAWDLTLTVLDAQGHKALADRRLLLP